MKTVADPPPPEMMTEFNGEREKNYSVILHYLRPDYARFEESKARAIAYRQGMVGMLIERIEKSPALRWVYLVGVGDLPAYGEPETYATVKYAEGAWAVLQALMRDEVLSWSQLRRLRAAIDRVQDVGISDATANANP